MRTVLSACLVLLVLGVALPVWGDIVVFRNGEVEELKIRSVDRDLITVDGPYGQLRYPLSSIYWFCPSAVERPGLEYYWAGVRLLELHKKYTATRMFERAGLLNQQYLEAGHQALLDYTPRAPGSSTRAHSHSTGQVYTVQCKFCEGKGEIETEVPKIAMTDDPHPYIIQAA